jgi:hypothetical protein
MAGCQSDNIATAPILVNARGMARRRHEAPPALSLSRLRHHPPHMSGVEGHASAPRAAAERLAVAKLATPMLSVRDGRYGCHVEHTFEEAMATVRELQKLRQRHRDRYPDVVGNAVIEVRSPTELRQLADGMTPTPAGFFYNIRVNLRQESWEAVFVPWEKMHAYQRAMG